MPRSRIVFLSTLLAAVLVFAGFSQAEEDPVPEQAMSADSLAQMLVTAHGAEAWASAPYLRFDFGIAQGEQSQTVARHLWNRQTGAYRVEWSAGPDSQYVALVNVTDVTDDVPAGTAYLNGTELSGEAGTAARERAYVRFINDTYWLLAPLKVFDPGVNRAYVADSSDAEHHVLRLSFEEVGLTPKDRYWLYIDAETGRLDRWAFHLQSMPDDAPAQAFRWTDYQALDAPNGTVHLAARKPAAQGGRALLTNNLALPSSVPDNAFSNPEPMLEGE